MIMFEVILFGFVASLLTGGSVKILAEESLKGEGLLLALLPTQLLWPNIAAHLRLDCALSVIVWLVLMAGLASVLMLNAPHRWMLAFAALGISMNILVIGLNGAMPVSIRAASEISGARGAIRTALNTDCLHEEMNVGTSLPLLADVIAAPGPRWQRGVFSAGDVLLAVSLGGWVFAACRNRVGISPA